MAVAYDTSVESHTGTAGSASEGSFSWTHTPSGTARGLLVFVFDNANADNSTAVTWGGLSLTAVTGGRAVDTAGEPRACKAWYLGRGLSGRANDTVQVTRTNNANVMYAVSVSVTAGGDTAVHEAGIVLVSGDGTLAEQSVTDGSPTENSVRFAAVNTAINAVPTAGGNSTNIQSIDFGTNVAAVCRENTAGKGSRSIGFSDGGSDDRAYVALAVKELDPFPTAPILDDFNRANQGPEPSANWSVYNSSGFTVTSNQAVPVDDVDNNIYWNAATYGATAEVYYTIATKPANAKIATIGVVRNGTQNGYLLVAFPVAGTDTLILYRLDTGTPTQLGATITQELSAGDKFGIRIRGSVIEIWASISGTWTYLGERTDATHTGNTDFRLTIGTDSSATRIDDFGGGRGPTPPPSAGALTLTGTTPTLQTMSTVSPAAGAVAFTGSASALQGTAGTPVGALTLAGSTSSLQSLAPVAAKALSFSGIAASLLLNVAVAAQALAFTGPAPTVQVSAAAIYYVSSATGSDSDDGLSEANAWQTVSKVNTEWAAGTFSPADTILFERGGTYGKLTLQGGSAGDVTNDIQIGAYGSGALPIFTGGTRSIECTGTSYVTISNVRGTAASGDSNFTVQGSSHHITWSECESDNATQQGLLVIGDDVTVTGGSYHDNGTTDLHHGVYFGSFLTDVATNFRATGVTAYNNPGAGIQCYLAAAGVIERCICYNNDTWGIVVASVEAGADVDVDGCLCYGNGVWGLEVDTIDASTTIRVRHNTFAGNTVIQFSAIDGQSGTGNVELSSNICDGTGASYAAGWSGTTLAPLNNVVWRGDAGDLVILDGTPLTLSAFYTALGGNPDPTFNFIGSDPLFVTAGSDYHLRSGSPARNEGADLDVTVDLDDRPLDADPDLGAYQFVWQVGGASLTFTGAISSLRLSVPPAAAALTFTGAASALQESFRVAAGAVTLTGTTLSLRDTLSPAAGALTLTGSASDLVTAGAITPDAASLTFTGTASSLQNTLGATVGTFTLTGTSASLQTTLAATAGALALTGTTPTLAVLEVKAPAAGALTFAGATSSLQTALAATVGTLTFSGSTSSLREQIAATAGVLTLTGLAPTVSAQAQASTQTGTLAFTGTAPSLQLTLAGTVGTLTLSGQAVSLRTIVSPAAVALTLSGATSALQLEARPAAGALALAGAASAIRATLSPAAGALTLAGSAGTLPLTVSPALTALTLTGAAPSLQATLSPALQALTLTGTGSALREDLRPSAGVLTLTGITPLIFSAGEIPGAALTFTGLAPSLQIAIQVASGALVFTGPLPVVDRPIPSLVYVASVTFESRTAIVPQESRAAIVPQDPRMVEVLP